MQQKVIGRSIYKDFIRKVVDEETTWQKLLDEKLVKDFSIVRSRDPSTTLVELLNFMKRAAIVRKIVLDEKRRHGYQLESGDPYGKAVLDLNRYVSKAELALDENKLFQLKYAVAEMTGSLNQADIFINRIDKFLNPKK